MAVLGKRAGKLVSEDCGVHGDGGVPIALHSKDMYFGDNLFRDQEQTSELKK